MHSIGQFTKFNELHVELPFPRQLKTGSRRVAVASGQSGIVIFVIHCLPLSSCPVFNRAFTGSFDLAEEGLMS
jgi:hypothetical protein